MREVVEVAVNETSVAEMRLVLGEGAELITVAEEADIVQSQRVEIAGASTSVVSANFPST